METEEQNNADTLEEAKIPEVISEEVPSGEVIDDKQTHLDKNNQQEFESQDDKICQEDEEIQEVDTEIQENVEDPQVKSQPEDNTNHETEVGNEKQNEERDTESPELEIIMVEPGRGRKRRRRHYKGNKNQNDGENETDKYGRVIVEGRSRSVSSSGSSYYSSSRSASSDDEDRQVGLRVSVLQPASPGGNTDMFGRNIPRDRPRSRSNSGGSEPRSPTTKSQNPIKLTLKTVAAEADDVTYIISSESESEEKTTDNTDELELIGLGVTHINNK